MDFSTTRYTFAKDTHTFETCDTMFAWNNNNICYSYFTNNTRWNIRLYKTRLLHIHVFMCISYQLLPLLQSFINFVRLTYNYSQEFTHKYWKYPRQKNGFPDCIHLERDRCRGLSATSQQNAR